jgi:uncharacterized protein YbaR (Trm112 family)
MDICKKLSQWQEGLKIFNCPLCQHRFTTKHLSYNRDMENIVEVIKRMDETDHEMLCEEHGEQLHLFCEDEGQLICWRCERAQHKGHATALVEDAYQGYKVSVQVHSLRKHPLLYYLQDLRVLILKPRVMFLKYNLSHVK